MAPARLMQRERIGPAALLAICAVVGLLAGIEPQAALVVAVGLIFVLLILSNFAAGLAMFALLSFLEVLHLGPAVSVGKLGGGIVILAWIARMATRTDGEEFFEAHPAMTMTLAAFVGWIAIGISWSENHSAVLEALTRYVPNVLLILIVFSAVRKHEQVLMLVAGLVLGALAASMYGMLHTSSEEARLAGTALDPNELAALLVAAVALAAAFAASTKRQPHLRLLACIIAGFCVMGIFLTVSRGGLIALAASLLAAIFFAGRWRPLALIGAVCVAAGAFYYFAVMAPPGATERLELTSNGEQTLKQGRLTIWQVAERAVEANPVTGVGAGNFQTSARHYLLQPGALSRTDLIISTPKVAHNTYLGMAAELGVVGLSLFLIVVVFSLTCSIRAAREFMRREDRRGEALARGLTIALIGVLVADVFISQEYNKQLWLLLGLGPALLAIAQAGRATGRADRVDERQAVPALH